MGKSVTVPTEIRSLCRSHTRSAIRALAGVLANSNNDNAKIAAANSLLDRGWGRAPVVIEDEQGNDMLTFTTIELARRMASILDMARREQDMITINNDSYTDDSAQVIDVKDDSTET